MFQFRPPFESERLQLQELNQRLGQYLSRTKQLEQENAHLITEINKIRKDKSYEWEKKNMAELREMRRMVEQLSFEKCKAEMEREQLRKEFHMIQTMRSEESKVNKGVDGDLRGCEQHLDQAIQTNCALEERLVQLEHEYKFLEDAHRQEIVQLRSQIHSRPLSVVTQTYHGPPTVSMEEVQEYANHLSQSWMETCEMYRVKVEEMEESIKADQARLDDLQREKMEYASEFNRLRAAMEKQTKIQVNLEDQLMNMQENFRGEVSQYQMIIEELEDERRLLADTISEKLRDHQNLLQVKMDLGLEVAAYRALLEEEGRHAQTWGDQWTRERIIDIKMAPQPYTPRMSSTTTRSELRRPFTSSSGHGVKYLEPVSSLRSTAFSSQSGGPSRIVPISIGNRSQQSPAARRDMISFTKASQSTATSAAKPSAETKRVVVEERSVRVKESSRASSAHASPPAESKSVKVVSPPMMSLDKRTVEKSQQKVSDKRADRVDHKTETDKTKAKTKQELREHENVKPKVFTGEEKVLDSVSVEDIIENVMKPAGFDTGMGSDSKITYHVEKTEQDDGTTKTQIVLQSRVEEEINVSEDSALEELLSKGVKKVSLEDIKGTPTGSMIQNLLSLGLQGGEGLENKSVNVEIIEEPVESQSEEEMDVEAKSKSAFSQPSSMFFQIEELDNDAQTTKHQVSHSGAVRESAKSTGYEKRESGTIQEEFRDVDSPYYSQGQESQEYFVSTPDENLSEPEEGCGFVSYGHYGVVDDLSDERYYQEEGLPVKKRYEGESDHHRDSPEYMRGDRPFVRETFPECIIEEEVRVSPTVQESVLEFLRVDTMDPKQQLQGALEQIQGSVSGALKEELSLLSKGSEGSDNMSVDIKKVQQSSDNGTMTIVAELNVSQTLEASGLLEDQGDGLSEEQIMASLRASNPAIQQALAAGASSGYSITMSQQEMETKGMPWMSAHEQGNWSTVGEVSKTEKHIKLGPTERSFTFQMDANNSSSVSEGGMDTQGQRGEEFNFGQMLDTSPKVCQEKKIATVYLESTKEDP